MTSMPNIASVLKLEISRIARKESRGETTALKKAIGTQRSEIAALKRRVQLLEQELRRLLKTSTRTHSVVSTTGGPQNAFRFSPKGLVAHRKRLGLSAADCGLLVGASNQSIYKWEVGAARPRARHLPGIAALRALGKKEAAARLAELRRAA